MTMFKGGRKGYSNDLLVRVPIIMIAGILQWAFKLYDKDGGGAIDLSEMGEAVRTLGRNSIEK